MVKSDCCSTPQGRFFIGDFAGVLQTAIPSGGVITPQLSVIQNAYLGMTEEAKINYELEMPEAANMETRAGGLACTNTWLKKATLDLSVVCNRAETQAMASFGSLREYAGGAVTGEMRAVIKNATSTVSAQSKNTFVPFNRVPDPSVAVVVKHQSGTPTYVAGTDYLQVEGGIEVLAGGSIASSTGPTYAATIQVDYTALDTQRVDGLTVLSKPYALFFDGFDRMSGAVRQGWIYNARGSMKSIPLKTKDMVKYDFSFVLLPDNRIPYTTSNPTSQYFHFLNS